MNSCAIYKAKRDNRRKELQVRILFSTLRAEAPLAFDAGNTRFGRLSTAAKAIM